MPLYEVTFKREVTVIVEADTAALAWGAARNSRDDADAMGNTRYEVDDVYEGADEDPEYEVGPDDRTGDPVLKWTGLVNGDDNARYYADGGTDGRQP